MMPLESMTVLDFSQAYNGPYGTLALADMGARIIKVERLEGEQSRYWFPYAKNGTSAYYAVYNRNKECIAVDMRTDEGKEIIKKLYAEVDVVVENFKFGTIDKLGLGYDVAKEINPGIIFASSSGYGQNGPLARNTAYDNIIESMCGYMDMTGAPDQPPLRSGASVGDSYTGINMALGVMMAFYAKKKTGKGRRVDVSMLDTMFAALDDSILTYGLTGKALTRSGNAKPKEIVPYDGYYTKDGRYIVLAVMDELQWKNFCEAIGMDELENDPLYENNDARCEHYEQLTEIIADFVKKQNAEEIIKTLRGHGISAAEVIRPRELYNSSHVAEREMIIEYKDANTEDMLSTFGFPIKFSKTPEKLRKSSPRLGEDTRKILKEIGYQEKQIEALLSRNIVAEPSQKMK